MTEELKIIDKRMKETVPAVVQSDNALVTIFQIAAQKGYEPAFIEKMMELQERNDRNEARKAFFVAVAAFKENPPEVIKDKENSQFSKGDKKAMYTSIGNLVTTVNPCLGEHGLSASWEINQAEKLVKVSCKLSHRLGHTETVTMEAPPDISGGNAKNPIQQIKSTVTYLRALTFEAVTGLATTDDANLDDDGNAAGRGDVEYISDKQISTIVDMINDTETDEKKYLQHMKFESIETIPVKEYARALEALREKKREKGKKGSLSE